MKREMGNAKRWRANSGERILTSYPDREFSRSICTATVQIQRWTRRASGQIQQGFSYSLLWTRASLCLFYKGETEVWDAAICPRPPTTSMNDLKFAFSGPLRFHTRFNGKVPLLNWKQTKQPSFFCKILCQQSLIDLPLLQMKSKIKAFFF